MCVLNSDRLIGKWNVHEKIVRINRLVNRGGDCSNSNNPTIFNILIVRIDILRLISSFYMFNSSESVNRNRFHGNLKLR